MSDTTRMTLSYTGADGRTVTTPPFTGDDLKRAADALSKGPRMKHDPEFAAAKDQAYRVTADELRQFIERWERLAALEPAPVTVGKNDILRMIIAKLEQCESDVAPWALKWCDKLASALLEGATLEIVIEDLRALADAGEAGE